MNTSQCHPDRLFPIEPNARSIARELYETVRHIPIISPHGHTDPRWFAENAPFTDPVSLFIIPDHYIFRLLYSHGIPLTALGIMAAADNESVEQDKRKIWQLFARNFYLFRGTPSSLWLKTIFYEIFKIALPFNEANADYFFDAICEQLTKPAFLPRALLKKFNIEVLATTDAATDILSFHQQIKNDGLCDTRILPTYRPDAVVDPENESFFHDLTLLGEITGEDVTTWDGYLRAHQCRRAYFKACGATATDHGHPSAKTLQLSENNANSLYAKILKKQFTPSDAENFRAHMLWQFAKMSIEDGLVMQLHAGSYRNHNPQLFNRFGRDMGADVPKPIEYTTALKPLLDSFGNDARLQLILFTLDESTYSRELAVLAGHYPCLKLGSAWWFHDSPEGMLRYRKRTFETAGFYNATGFIDDTRAFLSIPARHDVARRMDARVLAELVAEHRIDMIEAIDMIQTITYDHAKRCFRL